MKPLKMPMGYGCKRCGSSFLCVCCTKEVSQ